MDWKRENLDLAALAEEVRLHLIITGVFYLEISLWETVLLRLRLEVNTPLGMLSQSTWILV